MRTKSTPVEFPAPKTITVEAAEKLIPRRTGVYDAVINAVKSLKPGQAVTFDMAKETNTGKLIQNVAAALQARGIKPPDGYGFFKKVGTNNELIVSVKPRIVRDGKARKAKAK